MLNIVSSTRCVFPDRDEQEKTLGGSQDTEGFGKLYPSAQPSQPQDEHSDEERDLATDVISRKELEKGRLSRDGNRDVFKPRGSLVAASCLHSKESTGGRQMRSKRKRYV